MSTPETSFYVSGGTLRHDSPSYVERRADIDLYQSLTHGEFCYVLTSRQMGKSSLMVRTAARLRAEGTAVVVLDLTALGQNLTVEQWYDGLLGHLGRQLDLEDELEAYWLENERRAPLQRWMGALQEVVLPALTAPASSKLKVEGSRLSESPTFNLQPSNLQPAAGRLVIFIDEIDAVRSLPFSTDEFFAAIRECYNRRTEDPEFHRLTFCLLGVATPSDLIQDTRTTPFNIGRRIDLTDFTIAEAAPLAQGISDFGFRISDCQTLLRRVLYWTGGHPYLTQRLCRAVADDLAGNPQSAIRNPQSLVDRHCETLFLSSTAQEQDDNLLFVRDRLLKREADLASLLDLYAHVRAGKRVPVDDTNPLVDILRLSGITRIRERRPPRPSTLDPRPSLAVRNRIYERVFDREWVTQHMPDAELRRQRAAFRRGLVRASAVASVFVTALAVLAGAALGYAHQAEETASNLKFANLRLERSQNAAKREAARANALAADLRVALAAKGKALEEVERSLQTADQERRRANRQTGRANQEAQSARMARAKAEVARHQAEAAGKEAVRQKGVAEQMTAESLRRLVQLNLYTGERSIEEGDPLGAVPWFAEALRLHQGDPTREAMHRYRLAAALRQCPRIVHMWIAGKRGKVLHDASATDLRRVVTAREDGTVQVWDTATDTPLSPPLKHGVRPVTASLTPDGRRLVTGCADGTVRLWEVRTGRPEGRVIRHQAAINQVSFSPDGRRVVTASDDSTARVWDAATGEPVTPPLPHGSPPGVKCVAFSPDGHWLITGGTDSSARVWDATTGQPITPALRHDYWVTSVAFSPDGRRVLLASSYGGTARLWDAGNGQPVTPFLRHTREVKYAAFSPDGRRVATASLDGTARVWAGGPGAAGEPITPFLSHSGQVNHVAFSPDGRLLATASDDRTARLWDAATGQPVTPPLQHSGPVMLASFREEGRLMVTLDVDGIVREWDLATSAAAGVRVAHDGRVSWASFSPDGRRVVTSSYEDGTARVWEVATGRPVMPAIQHGSGVSHAELSPDGRRLVTASWDGTARVWDAATGHPVTPPMRHTGSLYWAEFSLDGRQVVTSEPGTVRVWDAVTGQLSAPPLKGTRLYALSPDGRRIVTGSEAGARVWDVAAGRLLKQFREGGGAEFSRDGKRLLTWGGPTARVWDAVSYRPVGPVLRHNPEVAWAEFSPDGRRVVTSSNGIAQVWDARTGKPVTRPMQHRLGARIGVSFSPDGHRVLTGGAPGREWENADDTARVWDAATGNPVTPPLEHRSRLIRAAFSPDGHRVVTGCHDGTVRVWDVSPDDRTLAGLTLRVHVQASRRIDATGGAVALMPEALQNAWRTLQSSDRRESVSAPSQTLAWHRHEAAECERSGQWAQAIAHLNAAISTQPDDAFLLARRASACAALGQWDRAAADYETAVALWPAAVDLRHDYALVQLARGDAGGYRRTARAVAGRREENEGSAIDEVNGIARICAFGPAALPDHSEIVAAMERAVARAPGFFNLPATLGSLLYRAGRYDETVKQLDAWIAGRGQGGRPRDWLFLAMAHHRLGHTDEARRWLETATRWFEQAALPERGTEAGARLVSQRPLRRFRRHGVLEEKESQRGAPPAWQERLELELLRDEAMRLIHPTRP